VDRPETFFRYETDGKGMWHQWACVAFDRSFAVHIWARKVPSDTDGQEWIGGVEQHVGPSLAGRSADRDHCRFLGGPCCHDGSATAFDGVRGMVLEAIESGKPETMFPYVARAFRERWEAMTDDA
jgi:hypothetical protein